MLASPSFATDPGNNLPSEAWGAVFVAVGPLARGLASTTRRRLSATRPPTRRPRSARELASVERIQRPLISRVTPRLTHLHHVVGQHPGLTHLLGAPLTLTTRGRLGYFALYPDVHDGALWRHSFERLPTAPNRAGLLPTLPGHHVRSAPRGVRRDHIPRRGRRTGERPRPRPSNQLVEEFHFRSSSAYYWGRVTASDRGRSTCVAPSPYGPPQACAPAHVKSNQRSCYDDPPALQGGRPVAGRVRPQGDRAGRARNARPHGHARRVRRQSASGRRPCHRLAPHDGADRRAHRDADRPRSPGALGQLQYLLDPGPCRRRRGRRTRRHGRRPPGRARLRLEGRDARGVLVVHRAGLALARRRWPQHDPR